MTVDKIMQLAFNAAHSETEASGDRWLDKLRAEVNLLVADRDVLRSIVEASTHDATGWYYRAVDYMQANAKDWT